MMACIRNHHERWDGSGYPDKLKGEDIPLLARIVCLGDAYDAMATDRPYKKAIPMDECKKILRRQAGPQFDPDLVELFISRGIMEAFSQRIARRPSSGAVQVRIFEQLFAELFIVAAVLELVRRLGAAEHHVAVLALAEGELDRPADELVLLVIDDDHVFERRYEAMLEHEPALDDEVFRPHARHPTELLAIGGTYDHPLSNHGVLLPQSRAGSVPVLPDARRLRA
jgi:hypothetical protein